MRIAVACMCLLLAACSKPAPKSAETEKPIAGPVKILQFYSIAPQISKGQKSRLCYGVSDASTVALDPAVEKVWPALSRCFDIAPASTTKYTLTAAGADGRTVSQSVTVDVGPPRPPGPKILEVTINKTAITRGEPVVVCYKARNATSVTIKPGVTAHASPERGCVTDRPEKTVTYQVLATGSGGQTDSERVTVTVR